LKKVVLITGCSSGIGRDVAFALKEEFHVIATARKEADVKKLADAGFEAYKLDVTSSEDIDAIVEHIKQNYPLYALFNNAGYGQPGAVEDISKEALQEQFAVNLFGMWELTTKLLPLFRSQGYGRIINHSSVLGLISLRFRGAYNASKYAIEGFSDTLRLELAGSGIYVSTINTGPVESDFRKNAIAKFFENVPHYKNSFFAKEYEAELLAQERKNDNFTEPSSVVIANIKHALKAKTPKPRYYNTKATFLLGFLKRVLPTALLDKILVKI